MYDLSTKYEYIVPRVGQIRGASPMPPMFLTRALSFAASLFLSPDGTDRAEWRSIVFSATPLPLAYRMSPWGYSMVGILLILYSDAMRACDAGFYWRTVGACLCVQGLFSYMSDVASFGRSDPTARFWKLIDPMLASTLTMAVGPILCTRMALGFFVMPEYILRTWTLGVSLTIGCKSMGARAARSKDVTCQQILLWHCGWHAMPLVAMVCIACIVHEVEIGIDSR